MGEKVWNNLLNIIKMPYIVFLYLLVMLFSLFIPSKILNKVIKLEYVENKINFFFNNSLYLKVIALIITIITFTLLYK